MGLTVFLSACRPQQVAVLPTVIPTLTSVPRSTPLPAVPTSIPVGQKNNPLRLIFAQDKSFSPSEIDTQSIESAIEKKTKLITKIELVASNAAVLKELCAAKSDQPVLGWLSGLDYISANARKCGQAQLIVAKGSGKNQTKGIASTVIVRRGIDSLGALKGRTFCRISNVDLISWIIPSLLMRASDVDPVSDIKTIKDYSDSVKLVKAVSTSECDAAAIPLDDLKALVSDDSTIAAKVSALVSSVDFPYHVMVASSDIPLSVLNSVNTELIAIAKNSDLKPVLAQLLDQTVLLPVGVEDLRPLAEFAASTKLDFSELGS